MELLKNGHYIGERALFRSKDLKISNSVFEDGESPLKESENIALDHCTFAYKYPLWYGKHHTVENCTFLEMSRSGIWYTNDSVFRSCHIIAPKEFRRCHNILLEDIVFENAQETLWTCDTVTLKNVKAKGDYFAKDSKNLIVDSLSLDGNYFFDGGENITIKNSVLNSKDAFWNCKNVVIENCEINGEYFGWNSEHVVMKNCTIRSHQGFCYIKDLKMIDCQVIDSDLIFEYCSDLDCEIQSHLDSVKNPISGKIICLGVKELIRDDERIDLSKIHIYQNKENKLYEI